MKLLILQGLPASGKSAWGMDYVQKNKDWVRVNRDDLRNMRGEYWLPKQEKMISFWEKSCVMGALQENKNVILDATNLNPGYLGEWKTIAEQFNAQIEYKMFDVDVDECIKRDLKRANSVGEKVIRGMFNKYLKKENKDKYIPDKSKPKAVIFDIDGTLAESNGRSPFEWDKVINDLPIHPVHTLLDMYQICGYKIIIFTGRDGICEEDTKKWLQSYKVNYDHFAIRPEGNVEKDYVIKERMFNEIKDKYNIEVVIDDRKQVKRMWVDKGLFVFDVNQTDEEF